MDLCPPHHWIIEPTGGSLQDENWRCVKCAAERTVNRRRRMEANPFLGGLARSRDLELAGAASLHEGAD